MPPSAETLEASRTLDQPVITIRLAGERATAHGPHAWRAPAAYDEIGQADWTWDGARLTARVDRYGARALFYRVRDDGVDVSPSLVRLLSLGGAHTLDTDALGVFVRLGFFVGDDAPFREIRVVPAGGRLEWERGVVRVTGERPAPVLGTWSRDAAIDAYIEVFRAAVRRALPVSRIVVPLSGGRDSRHILLELIEAGAAPDLCLTLRNYPPRGGRDLDLAVAVAAALGVRHRIVEHDPSRVRSELRKNLLTHFCADEHAWFMALADAPEMRGATMWDGIGGDVLSNGHRLDATLLELMRTGRLDEAAAAMLPHDTLSFVSRDVAARLDGDGAAHRLVEELRRHASAHNPVSSFFFWNRTRREIALVPFGIMDCATVVTPFLERGVFALLTSLPAELMMSRRFHADVIRRAFPAFNGLPFDTESELPARRASNEPADASYYRRLMLEAAAYVRRAPAGRLVRRAHFVSRAVYWLVRSDFEDAERIPMALYLAQLESLHTWAERR